MFYNRGIRTRSCIASGLDAGSAKNGTAMVYERRLSNSDGKMYSLRKRGKVLRQIEIMRQKIFQLSSRPSKLLSINLHRPADGDARAAEDIAGSVQCMLLWYSIVQERRGEEGMTKNLIECLPVLCVGYVLARGCMERLISCN